MSSDRKKDPHRFGGDWTSTKLKVLSGYLRSYTTALKNTPFRKIYIDAFAGTGYREARRTDSQDQSLLFPDLVEEEPQKLLDGSARLALKTEPRFDKYIFIECIGKRCEELETLRLEFSDLSNDVEIRQGDANQEIQDICRKSIDWNSHRAVLFLDPYGMQVEWATIEAIAKTKAIDLWLLFPLGIGVNRLLKKSGDIPDNWRARLNGLLGNENWYDEFYKITTTKDLFGNQLEHVEKATMETIGRYFNDQLKRVFVGVADKPGILKNRVNNPLYLLCFAVGNMRGKNIALRIANHLLKEIR